jgi:exopolysaccharide biosynthesis polyprenyl glycosylphosphotransferase
VVRFLNAYFPVRTVLLCASEALLTAAAFLIAIMAILGPLDGELFIGYEQGSARIALIVGIFSLCMYYFDLYDSTVLHSQREVFTRLIQVFGAVCVIVALVYGSFPTMRLEQSVLTTGMVCAAGLTAVWRRVFAFLNTLPVFQERVAILGDDSLAHTLVEEITNRPELGFRVVSHITQDSYQALPARAVVGGAPVTTGQAPSGSTDLERLTRAHRVQRIVIAMRERRGRLPVEPLLELKRRGIVIQEGNDLYELITGKVSLEALRPSMLLFSPGFQLSRSTQFCKRVFSLLISTLGLLLMAPVMLLIAIAIKLDSPGPAIFRQRRVGKGGKLFTLYKFRSMYEGADEGRPVRERDDRCTRVGRWIRASRLDELPQLWNILLGDMHLVGPRPFVPEQENPLAEQIPFYTLRWSVYPGATGWAQVNRGYCETIAENADKLAYDLFYIKNCSIGLDLLVAFKTAKILLLGRGAR